MGNASLTSRFCRTVLSSKFKFWDGIKFYPISIVGPLCAFIHVQTSFYKLILWDWVRPKSQILRASQSHTYIIIRGIYMSVHEPNKSWLAFFL